MTTSLAEARALARGDPPVAKRASRRRPASAGKTQLDRDGLVWVVDQFRSTLRDVLMVAVGVDAQTLPHARHGEGLRLLASRVRPEALIAALERCQGVEARLAFNPNPRLTLEAMLVATSTLLRP